MNEIFPMLSEILANREFRKGERIYLGRRVFLMAGVRQHIYLQGIIESKLTRNVANIPQLLMKDSRGPHSSHAHFFDRPT